MNKVLIEDISIATTLEALMVKVDFIKGIIMDEGVDILSINSILDEVVVVVEVLLKLQFSLLK